ncbi:MAG: hypothetical protein PVF82_15750, partial [Gammaproteobacteria bacterium]
MGPSIPVLAQTLVDIRTTQAIGSSAGTISYRAAIGDCTDLTSIQISAGGTQETLEPSQASRVENSPTACDFSFNGTGDGMLNPQVTLNFRDGSNQVFTETFQVEQNPPDLKFSSVSIQLLDGVQHIIVQAEANDDVDLSYVAFSVSGIKASTLRASGGVIDDAKAEAFADTGGMVRIYPEQESQTLYALTVPVTQTLDADTIAHDGVVLLDIMAVDASGNQQSVSTIAFTGDDVIEEASALSVSPSQVIFSTMLETATIIPSVDFQFRGLTKLPGAGSGVSYVSSHPDLIAVTPGGVVYPLQETNGQSVTITVGYPGLPTV